jgi:hypothetical protein
VRVVSGGWKHRAVVVERAVGVDGIWCRGRKTDDLRLLRAWRDTLGTAEGHE